MNQDKHERLRDILGPDAGMSVPEDFFEKRFSEINSQLPPFPKAPTPEKLSRWQMLRPYIYMAAMFAGIWLMMQVFHRVSSPDSLSLENMPEQIALAMQSPEADAEYEAVEFSISSFSDDYQLETDVAADYEDFSEFERDFGYTLSPEYDGLSANS